MHILLVSKLSFSSSAGGAEIVIRMLCEGLVGKGHRVTLLSFDPNNESAPHENSAVTLINHAPSLYKLSRYSAWNRRIEAVGADPADRSLHIFQKLVDQKRFDVVNTHQLSGIPRAIWRAAAQRQLPVVHTIHDYYLFCPQGSMYRCGRRCMKQCWFCRVWSNNNKTFSQDVRAVVAGSQFVLGRHRHYGFFPNSYASVIRPASINRSCNSSIHALRPRNPLRLGFIGRLHHVKGLQTLFDMLRTGTLPAYELWVAGAGNEHYTALLEKTAAGLPVRWLGWLDRETFFSEIDVLVVPSLWDEPTGMVISEAVHHGVPAVASDRGGLGEIGREHQAAYLFDPDCPSSFRLALDRAIARLGTNANPSSAAQPSYVEDLVDSYEALLKRVCNPER
jgi:glycosyltransferase involved in cell wall biosynthesis